MSTAATAKRRETRQIGLGAMRQAIRDATLRPESETIAELRESLARIEPCLTRAQRRALRWVRTARAEQRGRPFADALLEQFPLDSAQGRTLMYLAEALLRTPDATRADQLIAERLTELRDPASGLPGPAGDPAPPAAAPERSFWVRAGLKVLTGVSRLLPDVGRELGGYWSVASLSKPLVAPVVRATLRRSMSALGEAFIVGNTIEQALARGRDRAELSLCSFDVLGEGARTEQDAQRYFEAYEAAIEALRHQPPGTIHQRSSISVKLSALEPRYTSLQSERVREKLVPRMLQLARHAAASGIGLTIDAEEADRLDISLGIVEALARDARTRDWNGLGLAVQAYGRRAPLVIDWVAQLAREVNRQMTVRLVKGAYWDSEIKRAQERGLRSFPVFTSKAATDACYIDCARRLLAANDHLYPQFATHNALTLAVVLELAPSTARFEFQRLHGMGEVLFQVVRSEFPDVAPVRTYAPVGSHEDLLPYLVRRLLENGANTSFVHQFLNPGIPEEQVVRHPLNALNESLQGGGATSPAATDATAVRAGATPPNTGGELLNTAATLPNVAAADARKRIREPQALYGSERRNSLGADFGNPAEIATLLDELDRWSGHAHQGGPILDGKGSRDLATPVSSPTNSGDVVGVSRDATPAEIVRAMDLAAQGQQAWDARPAGERASCLERAADLLEERRAQFLSLLVREAGKTLPDAVAELREAVDFCRYYAARGRELFATPNSLQGPTGEQNLLSLHGRGVFVCISPWNFPLAIFTGQITAALMAGNSVVAKPAPATPLIAHAMTLLLHEAGIPANVLQLTPADGPEFGEVALRHAALAGVAFTGSTATATTINRTLAQREGPIVPLIAETGGVNAMIVDATALPEQVVDDVITSAFTSAGQRCSALRVLYLQDEIADRVLEMLIGAMKTLTIGDPADIATDVGPVISGAARYKLQKHAARMEREATLLYACPLDSTHENGHFFPPHLFELRSLDQLRTEEFGPILHVARFRADRLADVLAAVRNTGFGLTLGVHSRLENMAAHVFRSVAVGNTYVNRNMIGAVVGVQPFGGQGLSGTGPKAGGPHYLLRFANERTLTINTVAVGGNVELLS